MRSRGIFAGSSVWLEKATPWESEQETDGATHLAAEGVTTSSNQFLARPPRAEAVTQVRALEGDLRAVSRAIHAKPETAFAEHWAAKLLEEWLTNHGFVVTRPVGGLETAFVARSGGAPAARPAVAFLAEYDALPGLGHACGHNLIGAGAVVAATAVVNAHPELAGQVVVIGTPAEEGGGGKVLLHDRGVFDEVDIAMMFHPADRTLPWRRAKASAHLRVTFLGRSAHAAKNPEDGINALAAMIQLFVAVDGLRQHLRPSSQIHGIITHGGDAANVVPERTEAIFLVRGATTEDALSLVRRFQNCAEGAALASGATVEVVETAPLYLERRNNETLAARVAEYLLGANVKVDTVSPDEPAGSSDIGNVSQVLPTIHPYIAVAPRGTPSHSSAFRDIAGSDCAVDRTLPMVIALVSAAIDVLDDPTFLDAIRAEFKNERSSSSYKSKAGGQGDSTQ